MKSYISFTALFLILLALLISCRTERDAATTVVTPTSMVITEEAPVDPTPTMPFVQETGDQLTICMEEEPATLYWLGRSTLFDEALLHALYENDFTTLSFDYQAQGLEAIPSLARGDAAFRVVPVNEGDKVVDAAGTAAILEPGLEVVNAEGELTTFDGSTVLMQQLVVDFVMKQRNWSDGQPVTAADSVYGFTLAADPDTPSEKFKIERTASYQATGNLSVRWTGLPGFRDESFQTNFHHPLPQHAWQGLSAAELVTAGRSHRMPVGDGPFKIVEWVPGEEMLLEANPFYYRAQEDLPRVPSVHFRFIRNTKQRISNLLAGECQILTHEGLDLELIPFFLEAAEENLLKVAIRPGRERWQISFGINSASDYGDGAGRPDWFEDTRVRQAIALCTNRQEIVDRVLAGQSFIADSYVHTAHPLYAEDAANWPFDRTAANALLDEVGLLDSNFDGIREDPASGADFRVSLITSHDRAERAVAEIMKESLQACGIDLVIEALSDPLRYAEGEENRINGRRFDLALTRKMTTHLPNCEQFASWEISGPDGEADPASTVLYAGWDGENHSGWSNGEYDAACAGALTEMPGTVDHALLHEQAQLVFAENLPALPLFFYPRTVAAASKVPHVNNDPSQNSELWNIYALDIGR